MAIDPRKDRPSWLLGATWLDPLLAPGLRRAEPRRRLQARLIASAASAYAIPILILLALTDTSWLRPGPISDGHLRPAGFFLFSGAALWALRGPGRVGLAANLYLAGGLFVIVATALATGGLRSPALPWVVVFPLIAQTIGGDRLLSSWGSLAALAVPLLLVAPVLSGGPWDVGSPVHFANALVGVFAVVAMAHFVALENQRHLRAVESAAERAEKASRAKSDLLAHTSHELNTPLVPILGYAEEIRDGSGTPEHRQAAEHILHAGLHLKDLISDLLDMARAESGEIRLSKQPVEVASVMDSVERLCALRAQEYDVTLAIRVTDAVPRSLLLDPKRLLEILVNLVSNAVRFSPGGRVETVVDWESSSDHAGVLLLSVEDTGTGIPPDRIEQIFEPFAQVSEANPDHTGLGLAITQRLLEAVGGTIRVQSTVGQGTRFDLRHPAEIFRSRSAPKPAETAPEKPLEGLQVLVADDSEDIRRLFHRLLERAGADVTLAADGSEVMELWKQKAETRFDVIVMDISMPGVPGDQATRELRQLGCEIPIIACSASAREQISYVEGFDAMLEKPARREALIALIARVAGRT